MDRATDEWGVKVERVEVKDVRLPVQMQRAMATEAEATREARAKVVAAEGEQKASVALKMAADTISQNPIALQLRYMQTLVILFNKKKNKQHRYYVIEIFLNNSIRIRNILRYF